ncbi:MAG: hypothetical protein M1817_003004 [Caeruleum heppii]|nr:MAG: hypothetical protein M1817_003004 [Caeruleum heppii]
MASIPPQSSTSHQRLSPQPSTSNSTSHASNDQPSLPSTSSADVPTTDDATTSSSHQAESTDQNQTAASAPTPSTPNQESSAPEPRKCWICFSDETEDPPSSSPWRRPCTCALTAHESCLLDWIADLQSPNSRKRNAHSKILCPQCKTEIHVARPRSVVVDGIDTVERLAQRVMLPGAVAVLGGCLWTGCLAHGMATVRVIFGAEEASRILGTHAVTSTDVAGRLFRALYPFTSPGQTWGWRVGFGVPLIPITLILSRTKLADSVLPVLPLVFFATLPAENERLDLTAWPPSASMTLAMLPYLRGIYNEVYERVFGERERRWLKEVQPRAGEMGPGEIAGDVDEAIGQGQIADEDGDGAGQNAADVLMQLNLEINIEEEFEEAEEDGNGEQQQQQPQPADGAAPAAQGEAIPPPPPAGEANPEPAANVEPAPAPGPAVNAAANPPVPNALSISGSQLASTMLGALLFPAISAAMGSLLSLILPGSWTSSSGIGSHHRGRPGLLQAKWRRSIVGGCLFVVLKDAALLFRGWRRAGIFRERRVVDYEWWRRRGWR